MVRTPRSDWVALARKYRMLAELRRAAYEPPQTDLAGPMRSLSREFPGSLRELDVLPLELIESRAERFERAAAGGPTEPWMEWMNAYHATLRVALDVKRRLEGRRSVPEAVAVEIAARVAAPGISIDAKFVRAVASPPSGRLGGVVIERLTAMFGAEPQVIGEALFPRAPRCGTERGELHRRR